MKNLQRGVTVFVSALIISAFSQQASAFVVWAVDAGASANTNSAGNILTLSPGTNIIDLYFDTEGDVSWGWDISLEVTGDSASSITNVAGGDINNGLGNQTANGWQQLGGDPSADLNGGPFLLLSLTFESSEGDLLSLLPTSKYTRGGTFESVSLSSINLAQATTVPLPSSAWFLFSALGAFRVIRKL